MQSVNAVSSSQVFSVRAPVAGEVPFYEHLSADYFSRIDVGAVDFKLNLVAAELNCATRGRFLRAASDC